MSQIRVLVVDDHPLMREALGAAILADPDMAVVGEAASGQQALQLALSLRPDVVVMDLLMPGMDGLQAIAAIRSEIPDALILALTSSTEEGKVLAAVQAGALGYLLKDARREQLIEAIRQVSQGNPYLPPAVALKLLESVRQPPAETQPPATERPADPPAAGLTSRQRAVLALLGQGLSNREIAGRLVISEATVRSHVYHILGRLGLANRSRAVAYAARQGIAE